MVSAQIGVWALFAPRSFYDGFPGLGRAWVSIDGPFNEHLVRDVGALNLAVGAVFVAAFVLLRADLLAIAGCVALVWGTPHLLYHVVNTDGLDAFDVAVSLSGLMLFAVVGVGLMWVATVVDTPHSHIAHQKELL
jgi:hypothetical protein